MGVQSENTEKPHHCAFQSAAPQSRQKSAVAILSCKKSPLERSRIGFTTWTADRPNRPPPLIGGGEVGQVSVASYAYLTDTVTVNIGQVGQVYLEPV